MQTEQQSSRVASPAPGEAVARFQEFQSELLSLWQELPNKGLFFGLLAAWLVLFNFLGSSTFGYMGTRSLFGWMAVAYRSRDSEDGHGFLIPLVVLALFWWKRKQLLAQPLRVWWPGLVILALGMALHLLGFAVQQPRVS